MSETNAPNRFSYIPKTMKNATPPQYARVTASLSASEIKAELDSERGHTDDEWRDALLDEQRRRAK